MSTLQYLDESGGLVSYNYVEWKLLNDWLSTLNTNNKVGEEPPKGVNRGKIIEELEDRRTKSTSGIKERFLMKGLARIDRGYGLDWRLYENDHGYTHFEELLIYQPKEWRNQAREYLFEFYFDVERKSLNSIRSFEWVTICETNEHTIPIHMWSPILVVLFHPAMKRSTRYQPVNFLLAHGVSNPLPFLDKLINYIVDDVEDLSNLNEKNEKDLGVMLTNVSTYYPDLWGKSQLSLSLMESFRQALSPLDYFFHFQEGVQSYDRETLVQIGKNTGVHRLSLMKELDFAQIVGQRAAKHSIREEVVTHFWNRSKNKDDIASNFSQPLSMIFAGPSGNGKTELAVWLSKLLNKPEDDAFHKVDCGQLKKGGELFGYAGAYQGSKEGSALNNFISRMASNTNSIGVVLLDEIEKADKSVIYGLYQVLDKGEWTNKQLEDGRAQTEVITCRNIIFIMTTNAADTLIDTYTGKHQDLYTGDMDDLEDTLDEFSSQILSKLQTTFPFTAAFVGRISKVIPFLPMARGHDDFAEEPLLQEMKTVAKLIIEREEEAVTGGREDICMKVGISPVVKDQMANTIVRNSIPQAGVRGIQKVARDKVSKKLMHKCVLEKKKGGIGNGSSLTFSVDKDQDRIRFRENVNSCGSFAIGE